VIDEILPSAVVSVEAYEDLEDILFPEEQSIVARAVEKRRRAFTTGRACARLALVELGLAPVALPLGERGAPRWPDGVVGSITHCEGYRASAVAWASEILYVGIDAEPAGPLPEGVLGRVALDEEQSWLREFTIAYPTVAWDRLLFSAKEAVYKAWYPLTGKSLGFADAMIVFDPGGTFDVQLLVPGPTIVDHRLAGFAGRWLAREGLVLTAIAVPKVGLQAGQAVLQQAVRDSARWPAE
jgi:4'-phosphopantetheinyl transferase EntD